MIHDFLISWILVVKAVSNCVGEFRLKSVHKGGDVELGDLEGGYSGFDLELKIILNPVIV